MCEWAGVQISELYGEESVKRKKISGAYVVKKLKEWFEARK